MLIDELLEADKGGLFKSTDNFVSYSTGLLPLDYANATYIKVQDPETGKTRKKIVPGIIGGKHSIIIGGTGSLKTTLAQFIAGNIVRPFEDGLIMHVDAEKTALKQRFADVAHMNMDDPRLVLNTTHTKIEDVMDIINRIADKKDKAGERYKYEVKNMTFSGKPFLAYVPTVIIIDSIYNFTSRETKQEELAGNMDGGRNARLLNDFFRKTTDVMTEFNISCISINHIHDSINTNMFQPKKKQMMLLKENETIPGGHNQLYQAQNVFRNTYNKSNRYDEGDVGFAGAKVNIQIAKTKTTDVGAAIDVAFNGPIGFDPYFTLFEFADSIGLIEGRNPYLRVKGLEDVKFARKNFVNTLLSDEAFRGEFYNIIRPALESMAGVKDLVEEEPKRPPINEAFPGFFE